jgi:putative endonuclease
MFYVYILYSRSLDKLYKGKTADLRSRFKKHNKGKVRSTKAGRPWKLIYYEAFLSSLDASKEEIFLKTGKGASRIKKLLENTLSKIKD